VGAHGRVAATSGPCGSHRNRVPGSFGLAAIAIRAGHGESGRAQRLASRSPWVKEHCHVRTQHRHP
jgi:hypothetical protein